MEGEYVTLELKDDLVVTGFIDSVDGDMSILLGKSKQYWMEGPRKGRQGINMELVLISGKRIRYIHFPSKLNIDAHLKSWEARKALGANKRSYIIDKPK